MLGTPTVISRWRAQYRARDAAEIGPQAPIAHSTSISSRSYHRFPSQTMMGAASISHAHMPSQEEEEVPLAATMPIYADYILRQH